MILTKHQNSEQFAKGLFHYILTARPSTYCRPYNPWEMPEAEWILSPVKEYPAYRPSKYYTEMVYAKPPEDGRLNAGIYVEKGFTGDAKGGNPNTQQMDASWGWHHVLDGIRSGDIPNILAGMPRACRPQIHMRLFGGYEVETHEGGDYIISLKKGNEVELVTTVVEPCKEMAVLATVKSWKDLAVALDELTANGWLWVNFYIYLQFGLAQREGTPGGEEWTDQQVWNQFLEPLLPWITKK